MKTNITGDYASHTKEELLTECKLRELDVTAASAKADIVAALELSDEPEPGEEDKAPTQPPAPLPPLVASTIPVIDVIPEAELGIDEGALPKDEDFTDGIFTMEGEKYALCIHKPDVYGRTHTLKNTRHLWQGKEAQFNSHFEKA